MTQKIYRTWFFLVGFLWNVSSGLNDDRLPNLPENTIDKLSNCLTYNKSIVVADRFYDVITKPNHTSYDNFCTVFVQRNSTVNDSSNYPWPQLDEKNNLYISKYIINRNASMCVVNGTKCRTIPDYKDLDYYSNFNYSGSCYYTCLYTGTVCKSASYDETYCNQTGANITNKYIINLINQTKNCISCDNPVKTPQTTIKLNETVVTTGGKVSAASAVKIMSSMANIASTMSGSSATLNVGEGITGVLVVQKDPVNIEEISLAYGSPQGSINIISSQGNLDTFSRSVSVSKEAFNKAVNLNVTNPFAALMRFNNMTGDTLNSTILGNEVLAVEMGASITNLSDPISITFRNMKYDGIPSCHSWNGEGSQPNWTSDGCETNTSGSIITCQCSHLTFFAILMAPPNTTISSTDLNNLTIITQVGCGLSMLFLSIVLFMHFLMRKSKASVTTTILIHLVLAMFLLNFTFLINNFVASVKNPLACKIMGALMHYFMLATFTWFAAHAFHLCLQLYTGGKIVIHRYILKLSISTWIIPSIVGIVLLIIGKYGEQVISTDKASNNMAMCWITDVNVHYIVNIGYYALVFLFTFTTFIIIVSWLICIKRNKGGTVQVNRKSRSIVTILGLCCMLGVTWGFAFFAYGVLQIPAYYIFTVLNSFQGFFLFIYYYNTRHTAPTNADTSGNRNSTSSTSTYQTTLDMLTNPYVTYEKKT
ncbi:adhesion G-protein coupled receptor G5-like [Anabas testudineus]|uniref:Uncharacterized protein n=1 Tax=Anabas testudineus TaxID=64144 RepID=A0A3Q1JIW2_ANATE|nr:adhesion G-protein coupled receptor G5-like [Anabas testudineus]